MFAAFGSREHHPQGVPRTSCAGKFLCLMTLSSRFRSSPDEFNSNGIRGATEAGNGKAFRRASTPKVSRTFSAPSPVRSAKAARFLLPSWVIGTVGVLRIGLGMRGAYAPSFLQPMQRIRQAQTMRSRASNRLSHLLRCNARSSSPQGHLNVHESR